jgi:hypothetical protein
MQRVAHGLTKRLEPRSERQFREGLFVFRLRSKVPEDFAAQHFGIEEVPKDVDQLSMLRLVATARFDLRGGRLDVQSLFAPLPHFGGYLRRKLEATHRRVKCVGKVSVESGVRTDTESRVSDELVLAVPDSGWHKDGACFLEVRA